jgi:phage-related protein
VLSSDTILKQNLTVIRVRSSGEQRINKTINNSNYNSTYSKTFKAKRRIRLDGEKMAKTKGHLKNSLWVPKTLYDELVKAAQENHQTLKEYLDELSVYLLLGGEFDPSVTRRV